MPANSLPMLSHSHLYRAIAPHPAPYYRYPPGMTGGDRVSLIHVSNLHCSSCVRTIEETLSRLHPPTKTVVSIVLQSVKVYHDPSLSSDTIRDAILDAGFDVVSDSTSDSSVISGLASLFAGRHTKHIQQCMLCQQAQQSAEGLAGFPSSLPEKDTKTSQPHKVILSVGGMTCSACTNSVTRAMQDIPGVSEVVVSLLGNSASAVVERQELADAIAEAIDDCGFEATVIENNSLEPVATTSTSRSVSLRVSGMYCKHCPAKVMSALEQFAPQLTITKPLDDYTDPTLTFSYQPKPPSFTIRHISEAVRSKCSEFRVNLYHPPSLEERSRALRIREQRRLLIRLVFTIVVAIPTFIIGIVYMSLVKGGDPTKDFLMEPMWTGNTSRIQWALFFLATPVMFYSAGIFHRRSIKEIHALWKKGSSVPIITRLTRFGSMNLLVSAGVSVAYFSSIALLALATAQPASQDGKGDLSTYFDSVVLLTMFLLAGRFLESYSKARTADAITALASLRPAEALLLEPESDMSSISISTSVEEDVEKADPASKVAAFSTSPGWKISKIPVDMLEAGDIVRVMHGSTPPADGVIVLGEHGLFDESSLTGESQPIKKESGDHVYLGTINRGDVVHIRVLEIGGKTMLDSIMKIVREGQTRRAPMERIADVVTGYFVPVVTLLAILTWIIWLSLGLTGNLPVDYLDSAIGGWPVWSLEFAIAVFVVACPCGIGLAAPTALLVGSGLAAKFGILARGGGEAFQEASRLDIVVFDKTGTLTAGELQVSDAEFFTNDRWDRETILGMVNEVESTSAHPLASAIQSFCSSHSGLPRKGSSFEETAGRGLKASFKDLSSSIIIGNEAWMQEHGASIDDSLTCRANAWKSEAKSVVFVAACMDSDAVFVTVAMLAVTDILRPEAPEVISWLVKEGVQTWMVSGDHERTAMAVAAAVGIPLTNVIAGVLPHEKAQKIEWLQQGGPVTRSEIPEDNGRVSKERRVVAMIGDGVNDALALCMADVGVAIGSGSDVAISSASFILLSSELRGLVNLVDLSRTVIRRVKFNFLWAAMYNIAALPIAAGVIYPVGHVRLDPVWASLAMALSSVSVICSSLLLKLYRVPKHGNLQTGGPGK